MNPVLNELMTKENVKQFWFLFTKKIKSLPNSLKIKADSLVLWVYGL